MYWSSQKHVCPTIRGLSGQIIINVAPSIMTNREGKSVRQETISADPLGITCVSRETTGREKDGEKRKERKGRGRQRRPRNMDDRK